MRLKNWTCFQAIWSGFAATLFATTALATDLTWIGAVSSDWNNPANWNPQQVPTASNHVTINSGSVTVPADAVFAVLDWSGGTIMGSLTVMSNGVLNISGNSLKECLGALTNAGTVVWTGIGNLILGDNPGTGWQWGAIYNLAGGLFDIQNDQTFASYANPGSARFNNAGTLRKSAGSGTTVFNFYVGFDNGGSVEVQNGIMEFDGGGLVGGQYTTAAGAMIKLADSGFSGFTQVGLPVFSGTGQGRMLGGSLTLTTDVIPGLAMAGGTLYVSPTFQGGSITNLTLAGMTLAGTATVSGTMSWISGTINGALTVGNGAVLNIGGSSLKECLGVLTNAGTVVWTGIGNLILGDNPGTGWQWGAIYNLAGGLFDIQNDQAFASYANPGSARFNNAGTLRKSAGSGTTVFNFYVGFDNGGSVEVQSGIMEFDGGGLVGGQYTTAAGAMIKLADSGFSGFTQVGLPVFSGTGQGQMLGGSLTLTTDVIPGLTMAGGTLYVSPTFQGGSITNLTLAGMTLAGTATVSGTMNWTAGVINGALTVGGGAVLNIGGSSLKECLGVLTNAGTVVWTGGGNLNLGDYTGSGWQWGAIYNLAGGSFDIQNDQFFTSYANPGSARFNNAGTLRKSAGSGTTAFNFYVGFDNGGSVEVQSGIMEFDGGGLVGGQYTTAASAMIKLADSGFSGFTQVGLPVFSGTGQGRMLGGSLTLTTDVIPGLAMAAGTLYVSPTFQGGSITNLTLAGMTLAGTATVSGTMSWISGTINGALTVGNGAVLNIGGSSLKECLGVLTNAGTVVWTGGGNLNLGDYTGSGWQWGAIYNLAGGLFDIQNDQFFTSYANPGSARFNNAGTLRKSAGSGTTVFNFYVGFDNGGRVEADTGVISFQGDYSGNPYVTLAISLGSASPGVGHGQIAFSNPLSMDGTFTVSTRNGFRPSPGDSFAVLSYPASSNSFACFSGLDLGGGLLLQPHYNITGLTLTTTTYITNSALPQLFISRSSKGVVVQWPVGFPGWALQSGTNLASPFWSPVPLACDNQALVPVMVPSQFFRLIQ